MTYRTGNHWGVTIVREPDGAAECPVVDCPVHEAELVAVVTNGDQALADRICAALNAERPGVVIDFPADIPAEKMAEFVAAFQASAGKPPTVLRHTPDVDHARGAAEALAAIGRRLTYPGGRVYPADAQMLREVAEELGVNEDAPSAPLVRPETADNASGVPESDPDGSSGSEAIPDCDCIGHQWLREHEHTTPGWGES